ncbi:MAG TPA: histidinol-phosphate transaminase [Candidatus Obscuribacter sp.]|nr:histidinol-phosphate transaminase [Candidatus Obscuribacter sp.]HMY54589.1 histidinol-phosphate transaminase [Candidatus Obscuribacter sp.]HNA72123.1 histidinol-phosphate transaminase [Candidatus Obscuribacter sp.]HNB16986.1 histidinol-phosphate transaminase [Candidatus Obscuribacter sp.]HND05954.1 histidinol-phosphate transaminase [Candidatus Obscuribacter sp.]
MATFIQQLASMSQQLALVSDPKNTIRFNPDIQPELPKRLVPPHVESLKPYQPGRPPEQLKKELGIERFVNMASNENPLGPPPSALAAIQENLLDINRYPDLCGTKLREALAERYATKVDNIALGSGSESTMANIIRAFLHDDDEVLTSQGTFIGLYVLVKAQGIKLNTVPLKNYHFDLDAIADAVTDKTKIIYLCNPNNPTGTIFTRSEFENFIRKVPDHVLVILDEAYYEFAAHNPEYPDSMRYRLDNVLTLRTFAKAYGMAGVRLGYGLGHEYLIDYVNRIKLPFEPNILAQAAGLAALHDDEYLERTLLNNEEGMAYLTSEFDKMGLQRTPSHANFIMIEMGAQEKVARIHEGLLRHGIAIRPLTAFGLPTCWRVSIGLPEENEMLVKALKNIL